MSCDSISTESSMSPDHGVITKMSMQKKLAVVLVGLNSVLALSFAVKSNTSQESAIAARNSDDFIAAERYDSDMDSHTINMCILLASNLCLCLTFGPRPEDEDDDQIIPRSSHEPYQLVHGTDTGEALSTTAEVTPQAPVDDKKTRFINRAHYSGVLEVNDGA